MITYFRSTNRTVSIHLLLLERMQLYLAAKKEMIHVKLAIKQQ